MASMDQTLRIPVLHLHGDLDPYVLADTVRRSRRFAPTQLLHTIPGVGHYAHWEAPERVNSALQGLVSTRRV
jgi:pimeloyl-ACP methyl ester carboxylesterase